MKCLMILIVISPKPYFSVPENNIFHSITHLANDLLESVYLLQFRYISCGLLFDAECNKFDDQKPFFEVSETFEI